MSKNIAKTQHIAVLMSMDSQFKRGLLSGIIAFAHPSRQWHLRIGAATSDSLAALRQARPDGIITHARTMAFAKSLMRLGVPVVNCSNAVPIPDLPTVRIDNTAVGQMAVSYFQDACFVNFALCERPHAKGLLSRGDAFQAAVEQAGHTCHRFLRWSDTQSTDTQGWLATHEVAQFRQWISNIPKPTALFCGDDLIAIQMVTICNDLGLSVPDDVAVLGVDNDEVMCQLCHPSVSSISLPHMELGYHAAVKLDQLISHGSAQQVHDSAQQLFDPIEVVVRASTDMVAVGDPDVAEAMRYIRAHCDQLISVSDVVKSTSVSRRVLETRFKQALNRTIASVIRDAHLNHAKRLLRDTNWPIERVAFASGYNSNERFATTFRHHVGQTPRNYRQQFIKKREPPLHGSI